jgi:hypothetical protein
MFECDVVLHRDLDVLVPLGLDIMRRYTPALAGDAELPPEATAMVEAQAKKRVAFEFVERRRSTWDHRKLGGTY